MDDFEKICDGMPKLEIDYQCSIIGKVPASMNEKCGEVYNIAVIFTYYNADGTAGKPAHSGSSITSIYEAQCSGKYCSVMCCHVAVLLARFMLRTSRTDQACKWLVGLKEGNLTVEQLLQMSAEDIPKWRFELGKNSMASEKTVTSRIKRVEAITATLHRAG